MVNSDDTNAINQGWKKSHVTHSTQSPSYDCWQGMLLQHPFPPEGGGVGSAVGGRGRATAYQQAENSRVRPSASSISIPPDTTHPYQVDALTRILDQPLSPTVPPPPFESRSQPNLLVAALPGLPCFLPGSWGIHLCLLLAGSVFGTCRFLQSCETKNISGVDKG